MSYIIVTGKLDSGKSTVIDILAQKGFKTVKYTDVLSRMFDRTSLQERICSIFGDKAVKNGRLDLKYIQLMLYYNNEINKQELEYCMSSFFFSDFSEETWAYTDEPIFVEVPYIKNIINKFKEKLVNIKATIIVKATEENRKARAKKLTHELLLEKDFVDFDIEGIELENDTSLVSLNHSIEYILNSIEFTDSERNSVFLRFYKEHCQQEKEDIHCLAYYKFKNCSKCPFPCLSNKHRRK